MIKKVIFLLCLFGIAHADDFNQKYKNFLGVSFHLPVVYFFFPDNPLFSSLISFERKTFFFVSRFEAGYKGIQPIMKPYGEENYPDCFPTFHLFSAIRFYFSAKNFEGFYLGPVGGIYFGLGEQRNFDRWLDIGIDSGYSFILSENQKIDFGLRWCLFSFIELKLSWGFLF